MKSRLILALAAVGAAALTIALALAPSGSTQRASAAVHGLSQQGMSKSEKRHLSGFASFEAGIGVSAKAAAAKAGARMSNAAVNLCPRNFGTDVLVNQNCLNVTDQDLQGRGQAQNETAIAQNPNNPRQMVAGFNDYRRGDGTCGAAFSGNGGSTASSSATTRECRRCPVPTRCGRTPGTRTRSCARARARRARRPRCAPGASRTGCRPTTSRSTPG